MVRPRRPLAPTVVLLAALVFAATAAAETRSGEATSTSFVEPAEADITSLDGDPLGPRSGNAERRHERQMAQQRLERIQKQLEHERVQTAERSFEIEI